MSGFMREKNSVAPKLKPVPTELIEALVASESEQDRVHLVLNVRKLGETYRLPLECQQAIAEFGMQMKGRGVLETTETLTLCLREIFGALEV